MVNWENYNKSIVLGTIVLCVGSSFQFGFAIGNLGPAGDFIKKSIADQLKSRYGKKVAVDSYVVLNVFQWVTTIAFVGGICGGFFAGNFCDKIGRKMTIYISHVVLIAGGALQFIGGYSGYFEILMVGRFIIGLNFGIGNCVIPPYLSEIAVPTARGAIIVCHQLFITIGIFVTSVVGLSQLLGTETRWPYTTFVYAVPIVISCICLPIFPESPRYWLMVKKNDEKGVAALRYYRGKENVDKEHSEILAELEHNQKKQKVEFSVGQLFTDPALRRPTLIAMGLQVVQQLSGINAVMFYSGSLFKSANVNPANIQYASLGVMFVNMITVIPAMPLMDIVGRRMLLLVPMAIICVDFAVLCAATAYSSKYSSLAIVAIVCVLIYIACFEFGLGPIPVTIAAEMFSQDARPKAMMIVMWTNLVFTLIIGATFEVVNKALGAYTFIIFLGLMLIFLVFCFLFVPETKNKDMEQIAAEMSTPWQFGSKKVAPVPVVVDPPPQEAPPADEGANVEGDAEDGEEDETAEA